MPWRNRIASRILDNKLRAVAKNALPKELEKQVDAYVEKNLSTLDESHIVLTYFDVHFDNFIVRDGRLVGMLDFERTDVFSIDYVLDVVQRMVNEPSKYASEGAEPLIKAEDYANLMEWYKEYYPELFRFKDIKTRLKLYAIDHDLGDLYWYPESDSLRQELARHVG